MVYKSIRAKIFLDDKQNEHYKTHGVFADTNSKIAEWMQEYAEQEINNLIGEILLSLKTYELKIIQLI